MPKEPYAKIQYSPLRGGDESISLTQQKLARNVRFYGYNRGFETRPALLTAWLPAQGTSTVPFNIAYLPLPSGSFYSPLKYAISIDDDQELYQTGRLMLFPYNGTPLEYRSFVVIDMSAVITTPNLGWQVSTDTTTGHVSFNVYSDGVFLVSYDIGNPALNSSTWTTIGQLITHLRADVDPLIGSFSTINNAIPAMYIGRTSGIVASPYVPLSKLGATTPGIIPTNPAASTYNAFIPSDERTRSSAVAASPAGIFSVLPAGGLMHYDGYRAFLAGPASTVGVGFNTFALTAPSAGTLSGTYTYAATYSMALPTAEIVEGELFTFPSTITVTNKKVRADSDGLGVNVRAQGVRYAEWSTTPGAGSAGSITATTDLRPGEYISFFGVNSSPFQTRVRVVANSGSTVTFSPAITFPGTTIYFSVGDGVRLYRTTGTGTLLYHLADVAINDLDDNGYLDNTSDATLITHSSYQDTAYTRFPAPIANFGLVKHQNRLCVLSTVDPSYAPTNVAYSSQLVLPDETAPTTLWFTPAATNHIFPIENGVTFPLIKNAVPTGLLSVGDILYVFFDTAIYYIQGNLSDGTVDPTFTVNLLSDSIGCIAPNSLCVAGTTVFFMSARGPTVLEGTQIDFTFGRPAEKELKALTGDWRAANFYYWQQQNLLLMYVPKITAQATTDTTVNLSDDIPTITSGTLTTDFPQFAGRYSHNVGFRPQQDTMFVFDLEAKAWSRWDGINAFGGMCAYGKDLLTVAVARSKNSPNPWQLNRLSFDSALDDNGSPILMQYFSKWEDAGQPSLHKIFPRLQLFSTEGDGTQNFSVTVKTEKNWVEGIYDQNFPVDFTDGRGYAETPYATTPYGDPELPEKVVPLTNQKAKSLRVTLESNSRQRVKITSMTLETAMPYENMKDD